MGKLSPGFLDELFRSLAADDPRVLLGPRVGCDVAVIDMGTRYLIAKSDPITFATDAAGYYAVHVNANDIATSGAVPRWMLATVLLPESGATESLARDLFEQISQACADIQATLIGGHIEVTYGLDRPVICGHMLGEVDKERLVTSSGAQPGDVVLVTKTVPVEGTSIITREKADDLRERGYSEAEIERGQRMLYDPGISVLRDAQVACGAGVVHAMHDPTEGGIITGLWELAEASGVGLDVDLDAIPVDPLGQRLCAEYGLDPHGTIASGSLLIAAAPTDAAHIADALHDAGIPCTPVGRITAPEQRRRATVAGASRELAIFAQDEVAKLFA